MKKLAIGIMSGTSGDGVSVVLASFGKRSFQLIDYKTFPYPEKIAIKIREPFSLKVSEISQLNFQLGETFAKCVLGVLKKNRAASQKVAVIGSHGQTLFHNPLSPPLLKGEVRGGFNKRQSGIAIASTLQIGESSVIAERTGIPVVSDFRTRDIACGGEGAPLLPFFDHYFWGKGPTRAFQNIGGIANVTIVGKNIKEPIAFDTGPGNCLIDWTVRKISDGKLRYDKNGEIAKKGRVFMDIVQEMASHPYFKKKPPKSTGKELFNKHFLPNSFHTLLEKKPYDALSTITYFTAYTIAQGYKRFVYTHRPDLNRGTPLKRGESLKEVIVSGGGALNKTLMAHLHHLLQKIWDSPYPGTVPIHSIEKFGIHPQAKEPLAFAFFALRAIQGKSNHLPAGTGAKRAAILGKITPGKNYHGIL